MRLEGPSLRELDRLGDDLALRVTDALRVTLLTVAKTDMTEPITVDDLVTVRQRWSQHVDDELLLRVKLAYRRGVDSVRLGVIRHLRALTAAIEDVVPSVDQPLAELHLANARNRLVGIGDDVWEHARTQLLEGMTAGEGIVQLRDRVVAATDLAAPRAEVIARTEVMSAANAGSLDEMRSLGIPAEKEWVATDDLRTRESHRHADGQRVRLDEKFTVGNWSLDRPHDVNAPAGETVSCRCTLIFEVPDDDALEAFYPSGTQDQGTDEHGGYRASDGVSDDDLDADTLLGLTSSSKTSDSGLHDLITRAGINGPGEVVSSDEFDALDWLKTYRGLSADSDVEVVSYTTAWRSGVYFSGLGVYGNGAYTSENLKTASDHAGTAAAGRTLRVAVRPEAKMIELDTLRAEMTEKLDMSNKLSWVYLQDPSKYAVARGYDGVYVNARSGERFAIIFNRSAVVTADDS